MEEIAYWLVLPFVVAIGSAVLGSIVTQARMQVVLARQRALLGEARATISYAHRMAESKVKAAEAKARLKALDEFLSDVRVEQRHYIRERRTDTEYRKCVILQERLYFRNIPLSTWVEREITIGEDTDTSELVGGLPVFPPTIDARRPASPSARLLR